MACVGHYTPSVEVLQPTNSRMVEDMLSFAGSPAKSNVILLGRDSVVSVGHAPLVASLLTQLLQLDLRVAGLVVHSLERDVAKYLMPAD